MNHLRPTPPESALASDRFNHFCSSGTMKQILALYRSICDLLSLKPTRLPDFYPKLKDKLANSWKAQAVFKKLDARASHKVYEKGAACSDLRVLIIGAGPCGLRAAIECQLLGAKVVVIEKRDRMARNNVLHLWPFVIHDLRALGAKKFYGKFCAGSIDHISIRQLQHMLLKMCLVLGVEFHEGVSFEELLEPMVTDSGEKLGWRARVEPAQHPVAQYEFDVLIGADGKRNTLRGFQRNEFRGKLAIAITANFINRHTEQEAAVEEISGVAFIFRQQFFKDLKAATEIDLENIVYYKDETHYFVMTAKKQSLLKKGVLKEDNPDAVELLSPANIDHDALKNYALEAARYATDNQLPRLDFALNARGGEDVSMFDFTSMTSAFNASLVLERRGFRLLMCLVGDSLLEPFWPTGSGAARGFLSALDAAWAVRLWGETPQPHPVHVIAQRESIYRLLGQTTPENLNRDFGGYTLDPHTRYPNLNKAASVTTSRATMFYDSDDPLPLNASDSMRKRRRETQVGQETLMVWVKRATGRAVELLKEAVSPATVAALVRSYRPDLLPAATADLDCYAVLMEEFGIMPMGPVRYAMRDEVSDGRMRAYLRALYRAFKGEVPHLHHEPEMLAAMTVVQPNRGVLEEHRLADWSPQKRRRRSRSAVVSIPSQAADSKPRVRRAVEKLALDEVAVIGRQREHQRKLREVGKLAIPPGTDPFEPTDRDGKPSLREVGRLGSLDFDQPPEKFDPKPRRSVGKLQVPTQFERDIFSQYESKVDKNKTGKRRAAREIARLHFEKSLRLLAAGPVYVHTGATDLDLDYGLQQYRAAAPEFGERVRQLERSLMQTELGRTRVETTVRSAGGGGTVARLAAELASGGGRGARPRSGKPGDLLRAVGRIDRADWNVREIERQIHENRLGRPRPSSAERVPKWDRQQFLLRQKRLTNAGAEDERYEQLDQTIRLLDQKRRDSGRPQLGTKKVASLAASFSKKAQAEPEKVVTSVQGKTWTPMAASTSATAATCCSVCGARVFAAEAVTADGLTLHKSCFRCTICRTALRPGCYTISADGTRLACLRHDSTTVRDGATKELKRMPVVRERFGVEEDAAREMDEDEWTDRNFLASETSGAGGLSEEEESSSDEDTAGAAEAAGAAEVAGAAEAEFVSDEDSYGYDHSSEDYKCASSSSSEWESRREARRREMPPREVPPHEVPPCKVPPHEMPPREVPPSRSAGADSSEVAESESSDLETTSATEVSTDSEFEEEEAAPPKVPPAITVTAPPVVRPAPPPPPPPAAPPPPRPRAPAIYHPTPLSRTRSAGGLATKRALELKRLYLLGEPSLAPVRRSDSASHIDPKHFNFNISEIQKLLHPAPPEVVQEQTRLNKLFLMEYATEKPQQPIGSIQEDPTEPANILDNTFKISTQEMQLDTDSLSDDSSSMRRIGPNPPLPRLEVHNAFGELVQLDSLLIIDTPSEEKKEEKEELKLNTKVSAVVSEPDAVRSKPESESSESCRDAMTLALTETELSDWAADGGVLDDLEERPDSKLGRRTSMRNPRVLSAPKNIHETKNISALAAHVCGRTAYEEPVIYSNAMEHFQFADEGDDLSISILPLRNAGYMEFIDDDFREDDNIVKDRSINFIERPSSMFVEYPSLDLESEIKAADVEDLAEESQKKSDETMSPIVVDSETPTITELSSTIFNNGNYSQSKSSFTNLTDMSSSKTSTSCSEDTSPPLTVDVPTLTAIGSISFSVPLTFMVRPPVSCEQIIEETMAISADPSTPLDNRFFCNLAKSASASPVSTERVASSSKVEVIKREREKQTEVVRKLVLERMGGATPGGRKSSRRARASPVAGAPPPVPPAPLIPPPPERPPPPLRLVPSMSDPELTRVRRRRGIIQTVSDFFNRRVGSRKKWRSEPERFNVWKETECACGEDAAPDRECRCWRREGHPAPRPLPGRRRASHDPSPAALVASTHFTSYACCPPYNRPPCGPSLPLKIWSIE